MDGFREVACHPRPTYGFYFFGGTTWVLTKTTDVGRLEHVMTGTREAIAAEYGRRNRAIAEATEGSG